MLLILMVTEMMMPMMAMTLSMEIEMLDGAICEKFYKTWTLRLENLRFEEVQISFCWQGQGKMISQLVKAEPMSLYVDPRIARIP